ncbi:MAG: hypothetical protein N2663_05305 [Chlorobi bacterium]|jgi:hypothetical protein|nr:hypothetical protein [Chlorobiota bacterium]
MCELSDTPGLRIVLIAIVIAALSISNDSLCAQPLSEQEERIFEEEVRLISQTTGGGAVESREFLPDFPLRSEKVASFIQTHVECTERTAIILMAEGFRHTILLAQTVAKAIQARHLPVIGIVKGERIWLDKSISDAFTFPVIIDTTYNAELLKIFGKLTSPCWLTVWSCDGQLLYFYNLYQPKLQLDSLAEIVSTLHQLPPTLRQLLRTDTLQYPFGYIRDSIAATYSAAQFGKSWQIPESPDIALGNVKAMQISSNKQWFYFYQVGTRVVGGSTFDTRKNILQPVPIDSVFFRNQSPSVSDFIFTLMQRQNYIQALQFYSGFFDPCDSSTLYVPVSFGNVSISVKKSPSGDFDTTITVDKTNWIAVVDLAANMIIKHIPVNDSFNVRRFKFTEIYQSFPIVALCDPPLLVSTLYRRAYPRGYSLAEVLQANTDPKLNPITNEHHDDAPLWGLLEKQTGRCIGFGGQLDINKKLLGIGYQFLPSVASNSESAIVHENWTDYIWIVPEGIRYKIKSYYNPSLIHPIRQSRYPALPNKATVLYSRSGAQILTLGVTQNEYMIAWKLFERSFPPDQTTVPIVWQRYSRRTGALLSEWTVPITYDGLRAVAACFDNGGNLYVLYQDYHRSVIKQFTYNR